VTGKRKVLLLVCLSLLLGWAVGYASARWGPLAPRRHHYERFGGTSLVVDTETGKVCSPLPIPAGTDTKVRECGD